MQDLVGTQLDKYHIKQLLGKGGMGSVFLAEDMNLERQVAIKVINTTLVNEPDFVSRFKQEAQTAARLDHPSIIKILEFDNKNGLLYMVMEYVSGGNLMGYLLRQQQKRLLVPLDETLYLLGQVADALAFAHQQGLVHRDIKPDNVLLKSLRRADRDGEPALRAVVTDFGLVKLQEGGIQTEAKMLMGTLPYISPEQLQAKPLDGRSDLYSLGVVLYELVTGQLPYNIRTIQDAVKFHLHSSPPLPHTIRQDIPVEVEEIILKAVTRDINGRYQSGEEMAADLRRAWNHLKPGASTAQPNPPIPLERSAPVPDSAQSADQLTIYRPGENPRTQSFSKKVLTVGRSSNNDIVLKDDSVSSKHARLERTANGWQVTDTDSTNGTFLGDMELRPGVPYPWKAGESLRIDPYRLMWGTAVSAPPPPPPPPPPVKAQPAYVPPKPVYTSPPPAPELPAKETADGGMNLGSITLAPMTVSVAPGGQASVQAIVINESVIVDHFSVRVEGLPAEWVTISDETIQLMSIKEPGQNQRSLSFTIHPPNRSSSTAKTYPYRLTVRSRAEPRLEGNAFGNVMVQPFHRYSMEADPKGTQNHGYFRVRIRNESNTEEQFTVTAKDNNAAVSFDKVTQRITISSGEEGDVRYRVEAADRPWRGVERNVPVEFQVGAASGGSQSQNVQLEITPRIARWLLTLLAILGVGIPAISGYLILNGLKNISTVATATAQAIATETAAAVTTAQFQATLAADAADDDGDGLTNAEEAELDTDPQKADTDEDGLPDGDEVDRYGTDPKKQDHDNDGLLDGDEVDCNPNANGPAQGQCTNPATEDTDRDGQSDLIDPDSALAPTATATPTPIPTPTLAPAPNILPNYSFEGNFTQWDVAYQDVLVPAGWFLTLADNVPNTLDPHEGDTFARPAAIPAKKEELSETERDLLVWDSNQSLRVTKDTAPIYFTLYTILPLLAPGAYRFEVSFFADVVTEFLPDGSRVFTDKPLAAEVYLCAEGSNVLYDRKDWQTAVPGQQGTVYLDFVVSADSTVVLNASFRNRYNVRVNAWWLDKWALTNTAVYSPDFANLPGGHTCEKAGQS